MEFKGNAATEWGAALESRAQHMAFDFDMDLDLDDGSKRVDYLREDYNRLKRVLLGEDRSRRNFIRQRAALKCLLTALAQHHRVEIANPCKCR